MNKLRTFISIALLYLCAFAVYGADARWITAAHDSVNRPNTWIAFRKDVVLSSKPRHMTARIACDSKYWLWINGRMVVFEGQLKRGPAPGQSYYDEVDLGHYLQRGANKMAILVCYFGKSGFSHEDSGRSGLYVSADNAAFNTDHSWVSRVHPAYGTADGEAPNSRLSESNIRYDARLSIDGWQTAQAPARLGFAPSAEIGQWESAPWGKMTLRPIPMFRDYGVKSAPYTLHAGTERDTVIATLPGNLQVTPVVDITDPQGGHTIDIWTNHSHMAGAWNVRAQYITRPGRQQYESLGWMNGEQIILYLPKGLTVHGVSYRQTGYDTYVQGTFSCDDDFYNRFWQKALNTLYVNMRDTYMDCPERERAQWWGDEVILTSQAFYTLSLSSVNLMRKGMLELAGWQFPNGVLHAPVPGSYKSELPGQMLAAVGIYGFWNYYMNTGDTATLRAVYPAVRRYLDRFPLDDTGLTAAYKATWLWGDWGDNRDIRLIFAGWHYMALEGMARTADLLGRPDDARQYRAIMLKIKEGYNRCWNGCSYRHPEYMGATDDRVQALAVLSGIADASKYPAIFNVLKSQEYASPYMERYVMEALFLMGQGEYAMARLRKRIAPMVNDKDYPTLFEYWDARKRGFRIGSSNHAWSGGGLTVIAQQLMGAQPLEPRWRKFKIEPQYVVFREASLSFPTLSGTVSTAFHRSQDALSMSVGVPARTQALVYIPSADVARITVDGRPLAVRRVVTDSQLVKPGHTAVWLGAGDHKIHIAQ